VTNVPDQLIIRGIVNIVQGGGKLNNSQAGAKVAAMYTHHINDILPQLVTELVQFFPGQLL
jgi:hypothetical protein